MRAGKAMPPRHGPPLRRLALWSLICVLGGSAPIREAQAVTDPQQTVRLSAAVKTTALITRDPNDSFTDSDGCLASGRLRLGLSLQPAPSLNAELAYEQRLQYRSQTPAAGIGRLALPHSTVPFRILPLEREIARSGTHVSHSHELDRARLAWHPHWGEVSVGRQAVGLGRGVVFGAVDMFTPFSPLDVDREWRRGVDAVRAEYRLSNSSSTDLLFVAGESWNESALIGRIRGYLGRMDAELILGRRGRDAVAGMALSAAVGGAEAHAEFALFHTPRPYPGADLFGSDRLVAKALLGGSHTWGLGNGLTVLGEIHWSGFGAHSVDHALNHLQQDDVRERYLRGDTQLLGRSAAALQASYPVNAALGVTLLILQSPTDGSGLAAPSCRWDINDRLSLLGLAYLPWGQSPQNGSWQSEYGGTAKTLMLQLSAYF